MNAKSSHCMNRLVSILAAVSVISASAAAQPFERAMRRNFWNDGVNVTGIRQDSISISTAQLYGKMEAGNYRRTWEPERSWSAGAVAASLVHLEKFSMTGSFGFNQTQGYGMCGSMFIHPGFYPIDVLEFTPGTKTIQTYDFSGGISVDIAPEWRIGGKMEFESANCAKRKDLRHTNYRLDMTVAPSVQWHRGKWAAGMSYLLSKNSETVNAEQIGSNVAAYPAFFDKGLGYGAEEIWTGSGVHLSEAGVSGLPVREIINGVGVQASYDRAYADFAYRSRKGLSGEKQTIWYRFPGYDLSGHLGFAMGPNQFRMSLDYLRQDNSETVLEKSTDGGVTLTYEYGSNLLRSRGVLDVRPEYRYVSDLVEFCADLLWAQERDLVSAMYPYVHYRLLDRIDAGASVLCHADHFDFGVSLRILKGWSKEDDRRLQSDSVELTAPKRIESYYLTDLEYLTLPSGRVGLLSRYNFTSGLYIQADFTAFGGVVSPRFGNGSRCCAALRLGYDF